MSFLFPKRAYQRIKTVITQFKSFHSWVKTPWFFSGCQPSLARQHKAEMTYFSTPMVFKKARPLTYSTLPYSILFPILSQRIRCLLLSQLNQILTAFPFKFSSGTNPQ
jgi:hypothetical protein